MSEDESILKRHTKALRARLAKIERLCRALLRDSEELSKLDSWKELEREVSLKKRGTHVVYPNNY